MHFGWKTDGDTSLAILDAFRAAGGNFIQAASSAGIDGGLDRLATALSEEHVGRWMDERDVSRSSMVLATRLVLRDRGPSGSSLADVIRARCEASLRRLRTDHLDLFMLEWNPALLPLEDTLEALVPLVWKGLVRAVGASGFPAWRLMEARACASRRSMPGLDVAQHDYSLVMRRPFEPELEEFCRESRTGFLARSPLAGGFLVGEVPGRRTWIHSSRAAWLRERYLQCGGGSVRDVLEAVAASRGASVAQTALAWVLARESVTSAVVGVTSPEQLRELVNATHAPLAACDLSALEVRPQRTMSPVPAAGPGRGEQAKTPTAPELWTAGANN
ncbi:MAG: aldo/keto reductase [Opitutaceae bacterium]|nr:aldo/keto reductase [Opitutaceae bacterium]